MNYYPFHVGDYASATRHLTWDEDAAYRRLLDVYYTLEKAIPEKQAYRLVMAASKVQRQAVDSVLQEFFISTPDGWLHERCESELALYRIKKETHWAASLTKPQRAEMAGERRASKTNATPKWLTKEDRRAIASIYERAAILTAKTGEKHEVDHIVPLRSKVVCGLHVPWNLSVIQAYKNRAKSNSFEVA